VTSFWFSSRVSFSNVLTLSGIESRCRYYVAGPADYGDFTFLISQLISKSGVFVAQMGEAPGLDWPSANHSVMKNRFDFIKSLPKNGFKSIVDYEEVR
jgi:hypothetical protein